MKLPIEMIRKHYTLDLIKPLTIPNVHNVLFFVSILATVFALGSSLNENEINRNHFQWYERIFELKSEFRTMIIKPNNRPLKMPISVIISVSKKYGRLNWNCWMTWMVGKIHIMHRAVINIYLSISLSHCLMIMYALGKIHEKDRLDKNDSSIFRAKEKKESGWVSEWVRNA